MILSPMTIDQTMLKVLVDPFSTHGLAGPENDKEFQNDIAKPARDRFQPGFKYNCSAALIAASRVNH